MSSWFQSTGLTSTFNSLTESVSHVTESVKDAIPAEYREGLAKLTLNTEEMINERQHFREEALRKEEAKKRLDSILPWETKDSEREILVEECKEAILALSQHEATFFGPYEMPLLNVQLDDDDNEAADEVEAEETLDGDADGAQKEKPNPKHRHMKPTEESKEKLAKLQPLPPLLEEFDLDSHVGLIQRVLKEDPMLVKMQASFSGGGPRERTFWKNYFFHCAFTRYEAGLSIDEIWSYQVQETADTEGKPSAEPNAGGKNAEATTEEETVVFGTDTDQADGSGGESAHAGFQDVEKVMAADIMDTAVESGSADVSPEEHSEESHNNGFEFVDDADGDEGAGDPELDELEAEIARELEG